MTESAMGKPEVFGALLVSIAISTVLTILYLQRRCRYFVERQRRRNVARGTAPVSFRKLPGSANEAADLHNGKTTSASGAARSKQITVNVDKWGSMSAFGVDLGSFSIKAHRLMEDMSLTELPSLRSVCAINEDGLSIGEVEQAVENAALAFFSVTRDMALGEPIVAEGVRIEPYHAVSGALQFIMGEGNANCPVGMSIPPYLRGVSYQLYLAGIAAQLHRAFLFSQSAALSAALLRHRLSERAKMRPPRTVVFCDLGRSGISAYVCDLRETAASLSFQCCYYQGIQSMEAYMINKLVAQVENPDAVTTACIVEAAREIREDFASTPEYLASSKKSSSVEIDDNVAVEITREDFDHSVSLAVKDVEATVKELTTWMKGNTDGCNECEVVLTGGGFKLKEFKVPFDKAFDRRRISVNKISISSGLATLAAMQHPQYNGQRYDIEPLFLLQTVDEVGVRVVEETVRNSSVLTPLLGRSNSRLTARTPTGQSSRFSLLSKK